MTWDVELDGVRGRVRPAGLDSAAGRMLAAMYERAGRLAEARVELLRAAIARKLLGPAVGSRRAGPYLHQKFADTRAKTDRPGAQWLPLKPLLIRYGYRLSNKFTISTARVGRVGNPRNWYPAPTSTRTWSGTC